MHLSPIVLSIFLCDVTHTRTEAAKNVNARTSLKFLPIWIFNFPILYDWLLKYGRRRGRGWEKEQKPRLRKRKRRQRMYRVSGNPRWSYIFFQECLSLNYTALKLCDYANLLVYNTSDWELRRKEGSMNCLYTNSKSIRGEPSLSCFSDAIFNRTKLIC